MTVSTTMKSLSLLFLSLCLSASLPAQRPGSFREAFAPSVEIDAPGEDGLHTSARLIAETERFVPGETLHLGVVLEMDPHWHTYWINPGDSGMPTTIEWELPEGFEAGEIEWPTPDRYLVGDLVSIGYEGKAVLRVAVKTPADAVPGREYTVNAEVAWLECREACIPGDASLSITLTAGETAGELNPEFQAAADTYPSTPDWPATWTPDRTGGDLRVEAPVDAGPFEQFFPVEEGVWRLEPAPEIARTDDGGVVIRLTLAEGREAPKQVRGVLRAEDGQGYWIEAAEESTGSPPVPMNGEAADATRGLWYYLAVSLLAGAGMNLLPCIFPVLGLKISSFVEQAHGDKGSVRKHALVFAAGVLVSMWIVAGGVALLGGAWGAQFQDPRLVIGMLLVLTFFTLNLFGVFEMGLGLTSVGGELTRKPGYGGSFFQGVLLTVIGTPCTGPILVLVIAWMLAQPLWIGFLAFTLMGIGLASPYVILAFSPPLLERLPRPGTWMVTFKKASAFAMVAFLWVLLYVLRDLIPVDGLVRVVGALLLVCFAAWILGTWDTAARRTPTRWIAKGLVGVVLALAVWTAYTYHVPAVEITPELETRIAAGDPIRWDEVTPEVAERLLARGVPVHYRPWSPELADELRAAGRPVFVDFTAEWCTICKLNKLRALHRDEVMRAFADKGVVTLRADWTARDPVIAEVLASYGRRGVPVYLLHTADGETALLPEKLTPGVVTDALDNL